MSLESISSRPSPIRWGRVALWLLGGAALLAVAGYFSFSFWLNHYLQSGAFRELLNRKTSTFFHAEGEYMPIQRNGFSFYSDGYAAHGKAGAPLKDLRADQIRADFASPPVTQGAWQVSSLQIQRLKIDLGEGSHPVAESDAAESGKAAPSLGGSSWVPDRFELKHARIEETNLEWSPLGRAGNLRQMRVMLEPDGRDLVASGYGGQLRQAGWPAIQVDHVKLRCRYPDLFITDSLMKIGESDAISVSGQAGMDQGRTLDLLVKFNGVSISPHLPEDWRAGLKGVASGEAHVTGQLENAESLQATGSISLTGGQLEALPILNQIAAFTSTQQFRQFALQKAEARFIWTNSLLSVSSLVAQSDGLIRLEGGFTFEKGILQGVFQLGVTPTSLRWLPGSRTRVFTQEREGYAWTTLQVSGPLEHLNEDLSARLAAAAGQEIIQTGQGALENGAKQLLELLKPLTR